jgi:hypothetical protein
VEVAVMPAVVPDAHQYVGKQMGSKRVAPNGV